MKKIFKFLLRRDVLISLLVVIAFLFILLSSGFSLVSSILIDASIFIVITLSLNLETGLTGVPQFGRVIAVIAGAFAVGAIPGRIMALFMHLPAGAEYANDSVNYKVVPVINKLLETSPALSILVLIMSLVIAAISGAIIGWITSRPAIRLKEAYLGISLLAIGDFLMWVGHNWEPLVGGTTAVFVPDPLRAFGVNRMIMALIMTVVLAVIAYIILEKLTWSPFGRTLKMHRDSDLAMSVYGKDKVKVRTRSLVIGAALAAIAGGAYVIYTGTCTAISFTRLNWTFWPWAYMMLGGIGSNTGVLLGVLALAIARSMIVIYRGAVFGFLMAWGIDPIWLEYTLLGAVIIIIILFLPQGLVPERTETILPAERVKRIYEKIIKKE